ncbi:hypothetical protein V8F20_003912 [Naviculisporaceae sp. PSN 640]
MSSSSGMRQSYEKGEEMTMTSTAPRTNESAPVPVLDGGKHAAGSSPEVEEFGVREYPVKTNQQLFAFLAQARYIACVGVGASLFSGGSRGGDDNRPGNFPFPVEGVEYGVYIVPRREEEFVFGEEMGGGEPGTREDDVEDQWERGGEESLEEEDDRAAECCGSQQHQAGQEEGEEGEELDDDEDEASWGDPMDIDEVEGDEGIVWVDDAMSIDEPALGGSSEVRGGSIVCGGGGSGGRLGMAIEAVRKLRLEKRLDMTMRVTRGHLSGSGGLGWEKWGRAKPSLMGQGRVLSGRVSKKRKSAGRAGVRM